MDFVHCSNYVERIARLGRLAALSLVFLLGACSSWFSPFRIEVQQGNYLNEAAVAKLQRGMTREQVKFLLGTPLISDEFHADRWDYIYWRDRVGATSVDARRVALFFKDNALDRVEGDVVPATAQARESLGSR